MIGEGIWLLGQVGFLVTIGIHVLLMLLRFARVKTQVYRAHDDQTVVDSVMDKIKEKTFASSTQFFKSREGPLPTGLVIGKWFFAYIETIRIGDWRGAESSFNIKLLGLTVFEPEVEEKKKKNKKQPSVDIIVKSGAHLNAHMIKDKMDCYHKPLVEQSRIASEFIAMAKRSRDNGFPFNFIGLVSGPAGTGKTLLGEIIALKLKGILCFKYDPTQYGNSISTILKVSKPTAKRPLVLVLNEVDQWFTYPKETAAAKPSDWLTRDIDPTNPKTSSNSFLDELAWIDNVIVVMTTNKSKEELDTIDGFGSLFRPGRVTKCFTMTEVIADQMVELRYAPSKGSSGTVEESDDDDEIEGAASGAASRGLRKRRGSVDTSDSDDE